jgi:hypothetical protein
MGYETLIHSATRQHLEGKAPKFEETLRRIVSEDMRAAGEEGPPRRSEPPAQRSGILGRPVNPSRCPSYLTTSSTESLSRRSLMWIAASAEPRL